MRLLFVLISVLCFAQSEIGDPDDNLPGSNLNPCPAQDELTEGNTVNFLTKQSWADNRQETGTVGVSSNQLQVLSNNNSQDKTTCEFFNNEFTNAITKSWDDGNPMYKIAYYKAGNFYFVSIVVAQPTDQDRAAVGLSFIDVYGQDLNHIKGYAF
ncbi:MAG TPA: hypothetical protein VFM80_10980 [Gracilimonas sp.]|uniref:hypothetical protein n=1 Tax=Gracilimonas sp. TaxID=1974203 RepID=UPI002DA12B8C|nr:hypothetical protein [Gracilimonas sp.]